MLKNPKRDIFEARFKPFEHTSYEVFFDIKVADADVDLLALSDLLQWLFRSAVREGKPVHVYIPSKRMRDLLTKWLDGELTQSTHAA